MIFAPPGLGLGVKTRPVVTGGLGVSVPILPPVFPTAPIPIGVGVVDDELVYGLDTVLELDVADQVALYAAEDVFASGGVDCLRDLVLDDLLIPSAAVTDLKAKTPADCLPHGKVVEERKATRPVPLIYRPAVDDVSRGSVVDDV